MDFSLDLFIYALDRTTENELWEYWKLQYPNMDKETFISFEDYKNKFTKKEYYSYSNISYEDIEKEMVQVEKMFEGKEVKNNGGNI